MNLGIAYESSDEEDIGHTEKPQVIISTLPIGI
jgi:hypothetical protein